MKPEKFLSISSEQAQAPQTNGPKSEEKEKLRRQKQGRRLQEINARRREEKVGFLYLIFRIYNPLSPKRVRVYI